MYRGIVPPSFDGQTYDPQSDAARLTAQQVRIRALMLDAQWRTPEEVSQALGLRLTSGTTARIRDLRKTRWGGFNVERRHRGDPKDGLWEYRVAGLLPPEDPAFPSDAPALVEALRSDPEAAVLGAAREYAETCMNTDDPVEVQSALDRLTRAALNL